MESVGLRMIMRWRAWHPSVVVAALWAISGVLATGCHLCSADTSTTVFTANDDLDRRESPLAVLRTRGDGTPASSSLEIFPEDLNWVSKVLGDLRSRQAGAAALQCRHTSRWASFCCTACVAEKSKATYKQQRCCRLYSVACPF